LRRLAASQTLTAASRPADANVIPPVDTVSAIREEGDIPDIVYAITTGGSKQLAVRRKRHSIDVTRVTPR